MKKKTNLTWTTAMVLHRLLKSGAQYTAGTIRERIIDSGGDPRYLAPAAKWLRNHGIPVAAEKKRHLSRWYEPQIPQQMDEYGHQVVKESYSEIITNARSCKLLTGPGSRTARDRLMKCAVGLGEYLGLTMDEVRADCEPLHTEADARAV